MPLMLLFVACCSGFYSCASNDVSERGYDTIDTTGYSTIFIDVEERASLMLSDIADSIWYLRLEETEESTIGNIDKLIFYDDMIVVSDNEVSESVFVFGSDGRHQATISRRGRGPGEYMRIEDVEVDRDRGVILIYDRSGGKIVEYDFNGTHLASYNIDFVFDGFAWVGGDMMIAYSTYSINPNLRDGPNSLIFSFNYRNPSQNKTLLAFDMEADYGNKIPLLINNVSGREDLAYIYDLVHNSFFSFSEGQLKLAWKLDFGKYNLPESFLKSADRNDWIREGSRSGSYVGGVSDFQVAGAWLAGSFSFQGTIISFFYNKLTGEVHHTPSIIMVDLVDGFPDVLTFPMALPPGFHTDGENIISVFEPAAVTMILESIKQEAEEHGITLVIPEELIGLSPNDNPLLQFVTLKR